MLCPFARSVHLHGAPFPSITLRSTHSPFFRVQIPPLRDRNKVEHSETKFSKKVELCHHHNLRQAYLSVSAFSYSNYNGENITSFVKNQCLQPCSGSTLSSCLLKASLLKLQFLILSWVILTNISICFNTSQLGMEGEGASPNSLTPPLASIFSLVVYTQTTRIFLHPFPFQFILTKFPSTFSSILFWSKSLIT